MIAPYCRYYGRLIITMYLLHYVWAAVDGYGLIIMYLCHNADIMGSVLLCIYVIMFGPLLTACLCVLSGRPAIRRRVSGWAGLHWDGWKDEGRIWKRRPSWHRQELRRGSVHYGCCAWTTWFWQVFGHHSFPSNRGSRTGSLLWLVGGPCWSSSLAIFVTSPVLPWVHRVVVLMLIAPRCPQQELIRMTPSQWLTPRSLIGSCWHCIWILFVSFNVRVNKSFSVFWGSGALLSSSLEWRYINLCSEWMGSGGIRNSEISTGLCRLVQCCLCAIHLNAKGYCFLQDYF